MERCLALGMKGVQVQRTGWNGWRWAFENMALWKVKQSINHCEERGIKKGKKWRTVVRKESSASWYSTHIQFFKQWNIKLFQINMITTDFHISKHSPSFFLLSFWILNAVVTIWNQRNLIYPEQKYLISRISVMSDRGNKFNTESY